MIHLCLDTCTWIYLANGFEPGKLIKYLNSEIENGNVIIILPELVVKEWMAISAKSINNEIDRNFEEASEKLKKIKYLIEEDLDYNDFMPFFEEEEALKSVVKSFETKKDFFKRKAQSNANAIEKIFQHPSTIKTKYSQDNINTATTLAIEKAPPFGEYNSMNDALIFLQFIDYLKANQILGAYFITWNHKDFCQKKKSQLAPNLDFLLNSVSGKFYSALAYAVHSIKGDILTAEELKQIDKKKIELDEAIDEDYCCHTCQQYHSRISLLYFSDGAPIIDKRIVYEDPNQLSIFEVVKSNIRNSPEFVQGASCDHCGTVHIKCPDCNDILDPNDFITNQINACNCCGLRYNLKISQDRKLQVAMTEFVILNELQYCENCDDEFELGEEESYLCLKCKSEHNFQY